MSYAHHHMKLFGRVSFAVLSMSSAAFALSGCDLTRNHMKMDRSGHMELQDYRDAMASRIPEQEASADLQSGAADIPDLQPYISSGEGDLKPMPLVSISINQTVPLRDALFELASQAGYDIELDPRITGSIIFTAREKPFDMVIQRISEIAGLRYNFNDEIVRVEVDTPYHKTYKIDYLSYIRTNAGSIKNDVTVASGGGTSTGSKFEAATKSESDFWGELNTNLTQILGASTTSGELKTGVDPTITAAPANPAPVEPVVVQGPNGESIVQVAPPQATLQVQPLPTTVTPTSGAGQPGQNEQKSGFALNKQAGIISVSATERQHKQIEKYLSELRKSVTSQVLIEAKILEVSLNDEFSAGVNWEFLDNLIGEFDLNFIGVSGGVVRPALPDAVAGDANFRAAYSGNDVTALIDAVSRFGTVKALASPRLTVLNNQSAVLNVADNQVYFELDIDVTEATVDTPRQVEIDSEIKNVPVGVLINVQPSIDLDTRSVSMSVRPTVTRIVSTVSDPAVAFVSQDLDEPISSEIPILNVQEMDSVVKLNSGQAIVMGGLMQDRTNSQQQGVPVLGEVPVFGSLFRNQVDKVQKTELIVFLRATIVDGANVSKADKDIYKRFSDDRRPLDM